MAKVITTTKYLRKFQPRNAESILQYCYHANATPFVWKEKPPTSWHVTLLKSSWRRFFLHSSQLITFANLPFLSVGLKLKWDFYTENEMYIQLTLHSLWLAFYVSCVSMGVLFTWKAKDVCDVINEIYGFVSAMERHFESPEFGKKRKLQDWLVFGAAFYTVTGSIFGVAMFLNFYQESWYFLFPLPQYLKHEANRRIWPILLSTIVELGYELTQWISFMVITYINALFLLNVGASIDLLRKQISALKNGLGRKKLHSVKMVYSAVSLLQYGYNNCLGVYFWPFFLAGNVITVTATLSAFIITLGWGVSFITVFIGTFIIVSVSIVAISNHFTSYVHYTSTRFIRVVGSRIKCEEGRRAHRCMRICAIFAGPYFQLEKKTFLSIIGVILNSSATLLLSSKSLMEE